MRRLPWHVALRADRRGVLTALGIALGVAFCVLSFAAPAALRTVAVSESGPLADAPLVVSRADLAPFDSADAGLQEGVGVQLARATAASGDVLLVALLSPDAPPVAPGEARPAEGDEAAEVVEIQAPARVDLRRGEPVDSPYVPRGALLVAPETLATLDASFAGGRALYVVVEPSRVDAEALARAGYATTGAPATERFFRASAREVADDLTLVVAFGSVLTVLFSYEFMRSEVHEKRREIGVWRALGMRASSVRALLVGRAAAVALAGVAVGQTLALVVQSAAGRALAPPLDPLVAAGLAVVFVACGALGALAPAASATRGDVRALLEAAP